MKNKVRLKHAIKSLGCADKVTLEAWRAGNHKAIKRYASRKSYKFLAALSLQERHALAERAYRQRIEALARIMRRMTKEELETFMKIVNEAKEEECNA